MSAPTGFTKLLNQHGYALQHAVIRRAEHLFDESRSRWRLEVAEFPVGFERNATRIDIVFRHADQPCYLICECKRANPALSNWCFVRAPYVSSKGPQFASLAEQILYLRGPNTFRAQVGRLGYNTEFYHIGVEARSGQKGDESSRQREGVEESATQVLRGLNGLVDFYLTKASSESINGATFIPVVITTANLWTTDANLAEADLKTGTLAQDASLLPKPYVALQYHQSPGLKHGSTHPVSTNDLAEALYSEYVRTVHFVNASSIDTFLTFMSAAIRL